MLYNKTCASKWAEAYVLGNGSLGALVYGNARSERITFNHEGMFLPINGRPELPSMHCILPRVRELISENRGSEAAKLFFEESRRLGLKNTYKNDNSNLYPDVFHPLLDLFIDTRCGECTEYGRTLDFQSGVCTVKWESDGKYFSRHAFISRADNLFALKICTGGMPFRIYAAATQGYPADLYDFAVKAQGDTIVYTGLYKTNGEKYNVYIRVFADKGDTDASDGGVSVTGADEALVLLSLEKTPSKADYETLFERHRGLHLELYSRSSLRICGDDEYRLSNEKLLSQENYSALLQKMYNYGRYLMISSYGKLPPNAQGLWCGDWNGQTFADYVTNMELEMALWGVLKVGLSECLDGYFEFLKKMLPDWRENAQKFYNARGILASSRSTNHGLLHHFSADYPHEFWISGAGWLGQTVYEYWKYTNDDRFLLDFAIPYFIEVAEFYESFLIKKDGKYLFTPSISPENSPYGTSSMASMNATMDIAVAKESLQNLIEMCRHAEIGTERWERMLADMPSYLLNENGGLREWSHPLFKDNLEHRHISYLYPAMPSFEAARDRAVFDACVGAFSDKLSAGYISYFDENSEYADNNCGWSVMHAASIACRLKMPDVLSRCFKVLFSHYVMPNLLTTLCLDSGMFQVDANLGIVNAVTEMLAFSLDDEIELLPALPDCIKNGEARGIYCMNSVKIERLSFDEIGIEAELSSTADRKITVKYGKKSKSVTLKAGTVQGIDFER